MNDNYKTGGFTSDGGFDCAKAAKENEESAIEFAKQAKALRENNPTDTIGIAACEDIAKRYAELAKFYRETISPPNEQKSDVEASRLTPWTRRAIVQIIILPIGYIGTASACFGIYANSFLVGLGVWFLALTFFLMLGRLWEK